MELIQLIYVSDLVGRQESGLGAIVESAVRHNTADGITGMLLYAGGNFMQVLEGDKAAVHATYARICKDPRHTNTLLLSEERVAQRHFADWRMGFRRLDQHDIERFPAYAPYFQYGFRTDAIRAQPGAALDMLVMFAKSMT